MYTCLVSTDTGVARESAKPSLASIASFAPPLKNMLEFIIRKIEFNKIRIRICILYYRHIV